MGVQKHTMIIYIRISSEVTNTSTLPLNQECILSLPTIINTYSPIIITNSLSQLLPQSSSYHSSNCTIYHKNFLQRQPFFMLGVSPVLIHVFITSSSNPSCRDCPRPCLHCHKNNLHLLPLSHRIQIIYFVLQKKNIAHRESMVNIRSTSK